MKSYQLLSYICIFNSIQYLHGAFPFILFFFSVLVKEIFSDKKKIYIN